MADDSALSPPPAPLLHATGDATGAVARKLAAAFANADGRAAPLAGAVGGPRPELILLEPGGHAGDLLRTALGSLAEVRGKTRSRLWVVMVLPAGAAALATIDDILDEPGQPRVDAVVTVPDGPPEAVALALEAWIRLRHDAPSNAFADLRDGTDRACRFASVAAVAPAAPPRADVPATHGNGEHAALLVRTAATELVSEVTNRAEAHAAAVVSTAAGEAPLDAVQLQLPEGSPDTEQLCRPAAEAVIEALDADDATGLRAALAESEAIGEQALPDRSAVGASALTVMEIDAALRHELARTGFGARFGRRKRVERLVAQRQEAVAAWRGNYVSVRLAAANSAFAIRLADGLATEVVAADERRRMKAADRHRQAVSRWIAETGRAAARLEPPATADPGAMSRAWGRAVPAVRRYLLVPDSARAEGAVWITDPTPGGADAAAGPMAGVGAPAGVVMHEASGIDRVIAASLVMGLPLAALKLG